jgi:Tfp pilus assembly protein PilO
MNKSFKSLSGIILAVLILAVGYFGVWGFWSKLGEARAQYEVSEKEFKRLTKAHEDVRAFLSEYNSNLTEAERANKALPVGDADVAVLLDYYSKMVAASGLTMVDMGADTSYLDAESVPQSIQNVDWNLQVAGSFEAFKDFLVRVRRGLRLTDVLAVDVVSNINDGAPSLTLEYQIRLRTYYQN